MLCNTETNYLLKNDRCKLGEQSTFANMKRKVSLLSVLFLYQKLLATGFLPMHMRHRCRNGPRLIRGFLLFQQKSLRVISADASRAIALGKDLKRVH